MVGGFFGCCLFWFLKGWFFWRLPAPRRGPPPPPLEKKSSLLRWAGDKGGRGRARVCKPFSSFLPSPVFGQVRVIGLSPGNKSCRGYYGEGREGRRKRRFFCLLLDPAWGFWKGLIFFLFVCNLPCGENGSSGCFFSFFSYKPQISFAQQALKYVTKRALDSGKQKKTWQLYFWALGKSE